MQWGRLQELKRDACECDVDRYVKVGVEDADTKRVLPFRKQREEERADHVHDGLSTALLDHIRVGRGRAGRCSNDGFLSPGLVQAGAAAAAINRVSEGSLRKPSVDLSKLQAVPGIRSVVQTEGGALVEVMDSETSDTVSEVEGAAEPTESSSPISEGSLLAVVTEVAAGAVMLLLGVALWVLWRGHQRREASVVYVAALSYITGSVGAEIKMKDRKSVV